MRISFDLDDVLFVSPHLCEAEPPLGFPYNRIFHDRLRKGTPELFRALHEQGFEVWIYTSSYRTEMYIRALFRAYGVQIDHVVNAQRHQKEVQRDRKQILPQKMPGFYRISLHIDDEEVIHENGRAFGFRTMRIYEQDDQWVEKVLAEANRIRNMEETARQT